MTLESTTGEPTAVGELVAVRFELTNSGLVATATWKQEFDTTT
jgi:hypothetical protein